MQVPLDFFGCAALVSLAGVVGRQLAIRPRLRDDWTVVPNLWGAVVSPPGCLKSPALAEAFAMTRQLEAEAGKEHGKALDDYAVEEQLTRSREKTTQKKVDAATAKGNDTEARALLKGLAESAVEPPVRRRYRVNNFTVEALGVVLRDNPQGGVLADRDELRGLLARLDSEEHAEERAFLLECWNGTGAYTWDRIGRGTLTSTTCASLFGGIQPGPLRDYLHHAVKGGKADDGLLQRFQVTCWPDFTTGWRDVDRGPDTAAKAEAVEVFRRLDRIDSHAYGANTDGEIPWVRFAPAPFELFSEWRAGLEVRVRAGEEHPAFIAHLAKYRSLFPSIALLYHLVDGTPGPVGEVAAVAALAWTEYLEAHARRLYAPALEPGVEAARELDRHLSRGDLAGVVAERGGFRARDIYQKGWRLLDNAGTALALDTLEDLHRVTATEEDTGGRKTTLYQRHPALAGGGGQ
jgi:putative DNA primase/helicase